MSGFAWELGEESADSTIDWLLELPASEQRSRAMGQVLSRLAWGDVTKAMSLLSKVPPGEARNSLNNGIASTLAREDSAAALDWLAKMPEGSSKARNGAICPLSISGE